MLNKNPRAAVAALCLALVAAGSVVLATPAQAAVVGTVSLNPATGNVDSLINVTTSGPCASPATRVRAIAQGFGFPATGQIIYSPNSVGFSTASAMTLSLSNSFRVYATNNSSTALVGAYTITVQCVNNLGTTIYDEYATTMTWTTPSNSFANINSASYEARPTTTTTLATSLTSPQTLGTTVDLTATVDGGSVDPTSGTVEFFRGATSLGTATVGSGNTATLSGVSLPVGTLSLTAAFGATTTFQGSTSSPVSFVIDPVPATTTTTTLAVSGSGDLNTNATFDATVTPNNAVGKVEFYDGASKLGEVALSSGTAQFVTADLALGAHPSLKAVFVPTNSGDFVTSQSSLQSYTVVFNGDSDTQTVSASIPNGSLNISIDGDAAVTLSGALDSTGARFEAAGNIDTVRVIDTRAGSLGWTASGQLSQFQQGGSDSISAGNVGWAPTIPTVSNSLLVVTKGADVTAANAIAIAATPGAGLGLKSSRTLASSAAGSSVGTATLGAALTLYAPTTTASGSHVATLTFTVI